MLKLLLKIKILAGIIFFTGGFLNQGWAENKIISTSTKVEGKKTVIEIKLEQEYNYLPRLEPGQGLIRVGLHKLETNNTPIEDLGPNIKSAEFLQNGSETLLEIQLKDMLAETAGMLTYEIASKTITFSINTDKKNLALGTSLAKNAPKPLINYDFISQPGVKTIFYTVMLLIAVLLSIKAYHRILLSRKGIINFKNQGPKLVDVFHLSPKQKIWIVENNNEKYMLGVTPQSMQLISTINDEQKTIISELSSTKGASVSSIRAGIRQANIQKDNIPLNKIQNLKDFKSALKSKMRKLKPLK